jgi:RNA polymerase sigma-70 factor (ECF subfamily)
MKREVRTAIDEDAEAVSLCKEGNVDAFESLVGKYQKRMFNIAFVSAYKGVKNFEGKAKFSTWLYAIVMNLSRNSLSQLKIQRTREAFSIDDPVGSDDVIKRETASYEPSILERLERKDVQRKVQDCIDTLDNEFKEVLVLRDIQGFSYDEITDMLKMPAGTVKSRLFRAREALKDCLKKVMGKL